MRTGGPDSWCSRARQSSPTRATPTPTRSAWRADTSSAPPRNGAAWTGTSTTGLRTKTSAWRCCCGPTTCTAQRWPACARRWRNERGPPISRKGTRSAHPVGELAFLDEAPACALRSATVVARTGNAEDVADHHVVMPRNVLPQLAQEVVLLDAAGPHERADVVPVRTVQRHHRPIPTEADDMAVLAQPDEIEPLHRTLADLQCFIHVEPVHYHTGFFQPQRFQRPPREGPPQRAGLGYPPRKSGPSVAIWAGMGKDKRA